MAAATTLTPVLGEAASCLADQAHLLTLMHRGVERAALLQPVTAALRLAHLLINGGDRRGPAGCCCCGRGPSSGAGASDPLLSLLRPSAPVPNLLGHGQSTSEVVLGLLSPLSILHTYLSCGGPDLLAGQHVGWLLCVQHYALCVARARRLRGAGSQRATSGGGSGCTGQRGSRRSGGGDSKPLPCADLATFLGNVNTAAFSPTVEDAILLQHGLNLLMLREASDSPACARCAPQQLLLVVEGVAGLCSNQQLGPGQPCSSGHVFSKLAELLERRQAAWRPWLPTFMQAALPLLSAWVKQAAQQLPGSSNGAEWANTVLHTASLLVRLPGGMLHPVQGDPPSTPLEQLMACMQLALRSQPVSVELPLGTAAAAEVLVVSALTGARPRAWRAGWPDVGSAVSGLPDLPACLPAHQLAVRTLP